ncbi:MAG: hypothetical protein WCE21_01185 [Candidatus Babeliales bacterium]
MIKAFAILCITSMCTGFLEGYTVHHAITNKQDTALTITITVSLEPDELLYADGVRFEANNPHVTIDWHGAQKATMVYDPVSKRSLLAWHKCASFMVTMRTEKAVLPIPLTVWCTILTNHKQHAPLVTVPVLQHPSVATKTETNKQYADAVAAIAQPCFTASQQQTHSHAARQLLRWLKRTSALSTFLILFCLSLAMGIILLHWRYRVHWYHGWLYLTVATIIACGSWLATGAHHPLHHLPLIISIGIAGIILCASRFHAFDRTIGMACITSAIAIGMYYTMLLLYR